MRRNAEEPLQTGADIKEAPLAVRLPDDLIDDAVGQVVAEPPKAFLALLDTQPRGFQILNDAHKRGGYRAQDRPWGPGWGTRSRWHGRLPETKVRIGLQGLRESR